MWVDRRDAQDLVVVLVFIVILYLLLSEGSC